MPTITKQPIPGNDTYTSEADPTVNYSLASALHLQEDGTPADSWRSILIRFTLPSSIPKNVVITSAILTVYWTTVGGTARPFEVGRTNPGWIVDEATYNHFVTGLPWDGGNIEQAGNTDTTHAVSGNLPTSTGLWDFPDIKDLVQDAVSSRSRVLSLHIYRTSSASGLWKIASGNYFNPSYVPLLTVEYQAHGGGYMAASYFGQVFPPKGW